MDEEQKHNWKSRLYGIPAQSVTMQQRHTTNLTSQLKKCVSVEVIDMEVDVV